MVLVSFLLGDKNCEEINPLVMNGLSCLYHLDESILCLRGIRSNFSLLFHFSMKFMKANRIAPDGMPCVAASHLGLFCLPMSHKKEARLIWIKQIYTKVAELFVKDTIHRPN